MGGTHPTGLGQGNIFTPVCHSVHEGGGKYLGRYPPGPGTPSGQVYHPRTRYTPRQVHPPGAVHARRYGQQAGGTHPTGMHSCYYYFLASLSRQLVNYLVEFDFIVSFTSIVSFFNQDELNPC